MSTDELRVQIDAIFERARREAITLLEGIRTDATPPPEVRMLTAKEVAQRLSMSVDTVYRLHNEGTLPAVKFSERCLRWPETLINSRVLQSQNAEATDGTDN